MSDDLVYGIDLGTTYSAIAKINEHSSAEIIPNFEGDSTTPSAVYFEAPGEAVVGAEAKRMALADPDNSCQLIKRHMGEDYPLDFQGQSYTPESISALILRELVSSANDQVDGEVKKVVITVPAYFGIQEKEATKQAGTIADLDVVGIVTEPVAAALSLGIRGEKSETILVYDLGGGTFDTTIMRVEAGKVDVIAIDGNRRLGGADWDRELVDLIVSKFRAQADLSDDPTMDDEFMIELRSNAEETKKSLTKRHSATTRCRFQSADERVEVSREEFESATKHLVDQTLDICKRAVETAEKKEEGLKVDRVLLVGGSSRMPMIETALREKLGWDPTRTDFDLAVAKGAATYGQAAIDEVLATDGEAPATDGNGTAHGKYFLGGAAGLSVSNVLARGLGVEFHDPDTGKDYIRFIVHANDTLPCSPESVSASTLEDDQTAVEVNLFEQGGEREAEDLLDNRPVDNKKLKSQNLPIPSLPKDSPIEISLTVTDEGLARLKAHDPTGGETVELEAKVSQLDEDGVKEAKDVVAGISVRS